MLERAAESLNYCQQSIRPGCGLKTQSKLRNFVKIFDGKFLISLVFLKLLSFMKKVNKELNDAMKII